MNKTILLSLAIKLIGIPYKWGGNNPLTGYDCSGLCNDLLRAQGIVGNRQDLTAYGLHNFLVNTRKWRKSEICDLGDIIFYGPNVKGIRHCAMALDQNFMIEAGGGDSTTLTLEQAQQKNANVRIRQIDYRKDYLLCLTPSN